MRKIIFATLLLGLSAVVFADAPAPETKVSPTIKVMLIDAGAPTTELSVADMQYMVVFDLEKKIERDLAPVLVAHSPEAVLINDEKLIEINSWRWRAQYHDHFYKVKLFSNFTSFKTLPANPPKLC